MNGPLLVLFANALIAGRAKSRLCPPLTPFEAADPHSEFLMNEVNLPMSLGSSIKMVLGSDSPGLPPAPITELIRSSADVTRGPTPDGGIFAIAWRALRRDMFAGVRWFSKHARTGLVHEASADLLRLPHMPDLQQDSAVSARRH